MAPAIAPIALSQARLALHVCDIRKARVRHLEVFVLNRVIDIDRSERAGPGQRAKSGDLVIQATSSTVGDRKILRPDKETREPERPTSLAVGRYEVLAAFYLASGKGQARYTQ